MCPGRPSRPTTHRFPTSGIKPGRGSSPCWCRSRRMIPRRRRTGKRGRSCAAGRNRFSPPTATATRSRRAPIMCCRRRFPGRRVNRTRRSSAPGIFCKRTKARSWRGSSSISSREHEKGTGNFFSVSCVNLELNNRKVACPLFGNKETTMSTDYRIFGNELSPYSVKVRSYFRYKKIPHQWVVRDSTNAEEFQRYAKLPLIPLVITPDSQGIQDSTPIIEHFEALHPEPSIHPADPALAFLSAMIEEYGDEWGNKPMFHYRWFYEPDQRSAAARLARSMMPELDETGLEGAREMVRGHARSERAGSLRRLDGACADAVAAVPRRGRRGVLSLVAGQRRGARSG